MKFLKTSILQRLLWLVLALPIFIVSQLPTVLLITGIRSGMNPWLLNISVLLVAALITVFFIWFARKMQLASMDFSFVKGQTIGRLFIAYGVIFLLRIVGVFLLALEGNSSTVNQETLNQLQSEGPLFAMILLVVFVAPLVEEVLCRGIIPKLIFQGYEKTGYAAGALLFAWLHNPTNLGSWFIYGSMSAVLAYTAYRSKRLEMSILLHFLNNAIAQLLIILLLFRS